MAHVRLLGAVLAAAALAGCSQAEDALGGARDGAEGAVREQAQRLSDRLADEAGAAVRDRVGAELERAGVRLDGPPVCDPSVDLSALDAAAQGRVDCTARTTDGQDVRAVFRGRFSTSGCDGELVVTVAGRERVRTPDLQVCG
ncbi:hypothetical protein [Vallicoccus soli]|uniref:DUF4333 domain-containing protein n=1 Tax=Vallicoccus soli TaxID=2339232 RepID=A0A3A3YV69_9ACTN|nr:hypothetical protein [Vallicoccus soli]RJK92938.1 hypothetical protein D5H78_17630 [Vallicoccus soli]